MFDPKVPKAQSQAIHRKAEYWRAYLAELTKEIGANPSFADLRVASLWASTFAYVEWLAVFQRYETRPDATEMASILNQYWGWDVEIGKLFIISGRNPTAHVGQANSFHSYRTYNGLPTNVILNVGRWSEEAVGEWDKHRPFKAVAILPPLDMGSGELQMVTFFHQMLLDELLPILADGVAKKVAAEKDEAKLAKIVALNQQILH